MDKAELNKSQDNIHIKPKTIREFLAMKMNPKPIESSDEEGPGLKRSRNISKSKKFD